MRHRVRQTSPTVPTSYKFTNKRSRRTKILLGVLVAVIAGSGLLTLLNYRGGTRQSQLQVNDPSLLTSYLPFEVGTIQTYKNWTLNDISDSFRNVAFSQRLTEILPMCAVSNDLPQDLPVTFETDPECHIHPSRIGLKNCSAAHATTAAALLSSRICLEVKKKRDVSERMTPIRYSAQDLLSCQVHQGCAGGFVESSLISIKNSGLVSESCFPWRGGLDSIPCTKRCLTEQPVRSSASCYSIGIEAIKREVMANGPVIGLINLYDDFLVYKSGVYKTHKTARQIVDVENRSAVSMPILIHGWGTENKQAYWLIQTPLGLQWGTKGLGKMIESGLADLMAITAHVD